MSRLGITYEDVARAAEEVALTGGSVTIDKVRNLLGGTGSNTTISKYLNNWKQGQPLDSETKSPPPDLVQAAVERVWNQIREEAENEIAKIKLETAAQLSIAETRASQSESKLELIERDLTTAKLSFNSLSAEKELLTLDLKESLQANVLLQERFVTLQQRMEEADLMYKRHIEDIVMAHDKETQKASATYTELVNTFTKTISELTDLHKHEIQELIAANENQRHEQMLKFDGLVTENKKLNSRNGECEALLIHKDQLLTNQESQFAKFEKNFSENSKQFTELNAQLKELIATSDISRTILESVSQLPNHIELSAAQLQKTYSSSNKDLLEVITKLYSDLKHSFAKKVVHNE